MNCRGENNPGRLRGEWEGIFKFKMQNAEWVG